MVRTARKTGSDQLSCADYCVSLPEDSEECEQCWMAWDYFEHRKVCLLGFDKPR